MATEHQQTTLWITLWGKGAKRRGVCAEAVHSPVDNKTICLNKGLLASTFNFPQLCVKSSLKYPLNLACKEGRLCTMMWGERRD
jgi:hypothetical protein